MGNKKHHIIKNNPIDFEIKGGENIVDKFNEWSNYHKNYNFNDLQQNNFDYNPDDILDTLPRKLRTYYRDWLHGYDLRQDLSRPTFYRIRKQLKEYENKYSF